MFRNRDDAGRLLGQLLLQRPLRNPVVLGVPRGGVVVAASLAHEIGAELDILLARKMRAPSQPELAIGAVGEDGEVILLPYARELAADDPAYLAQEERHQKEEILRRQILFRGVKPAASLTGRSVIVVDDGIATGSTIVAALHALRAKCPHEIIVAVPVASPERLPALRELCDEVICLSSPRRFQAIGQFYEDFTQVEDAEVVNLLRDPTCASH